MPEPRTARIDRTFRGTRVGEEGLLAHRVALAVVDGPSRGLRREIAATHVTVGSGPGNDVVLEDHTVSRRHCEIVIRGERWVLRDLASTNGCAVNGTAVVEAYLAPGARIRLGGSELIFQPSRTWERLAGDRTTRFGELIGVSAAMGEVFALLARVAPTQLGCLITGETGTGKELAARAIHAASPRAAALFEVVDCATLHAQLVESELFGHEAGAFTGADRTRAGAFERAQGGTVLLDEIGELAPGQQKALLRVLEQKQVKRLGGDAFLDVDVRVIAATHRDLPALVEGGDFREDLFYRLAEVVVALPPLRDRPEDLEPIALALLGGRTLTAEGLQRLAAHRWPGNVRELRNLLRRALALAATPGLGPAELEAAGLAAPEPEAPVRPLTLAEARERAIAAVEKDYLERLLATSGGDLDHAASEAGLHRKSLLRLLRQHGIDRDGG